MKIFKCLSNVSKFLFSCITKCVIRFAYFVIGRWVCERCGKCTSCLAREPVPKGENGRWKSEVGSSSSFDIASFCIVLSQKLLTQPAFTSSKSTIETLEQGVKYVQS